MRLRILERLERKARAAMKTRPEFRLLQRKKIALEKRITLGKISSHLASDLKSILRLRVKRLLHREIYRLQIGEPNKA